jgi:hypothetical protein
MKRFFPFFLFVVAASLSFAQDMPPLPPLPAQSGSAPADNTAAAPAGSPALPPLPDASAQANTASPALPPLPDNSAAPANPSTGSGQASPGLPPLPDQSAAPASSGQAAPALPPLPNQPGAEQPAAPAAPAAPDQGQAATATESTAAPQSGEAKPPKKAAQPWWTKTKHRANVIFGGWVNAKGGNESSKIAWTSQEVLNALVFKGYKVIKEDGKYDGQEGAGGHQWREFTFSVPKSKLTTQVYIKQVGKKVWVRIGPSEPPAFAEHGVEQVQKMRAVNLKALALVKKKLGKRISPHQIIRSWEAPYSFTQDAVVE